MQGESFRTILETGDEPEGWKQESYYRYWMHMAHSHANPAHFGIRTKEYKLIFFYGIYYKDHGKQDQIEGSTGGSPGRDRRNRRSIPGN